MRTYGEIESSDGVRGADDARAYEALQRWHAPYDSVANWTQRACVRCRQTGIIVGEDLCAGCHADRQWTLVNRALCDLLHRRAAAADEEDLEPELVGAGASGPARSR